MNTKTAAVVSPKANVKAATPPAKPVSSVTKAAVDQAANRHATPVTPAATVKPATPATVTPTRLGKSGIAVLTAISKGPLTRAEISLATSIKSGFCSLLGHVDPSKTEPSSLSFKGYLTVGYVEGKSASAYTITDKGREALKVATTPVAAVAPVATAKVEPKPAATEPVKAAAKKVTPKK